MRPVSYVKVVHEGMCSRASCTCNRGFGIMWHWDNGVIGQYKVIDNEWRGREIDVDEYQLFLKLKKKYGE